MILRVFKFYFIIINFQIFDLKVVKSKSIFNLLSYLLILVDYRFNFYSYQVLFICKKAFKDTSKNNSFNQLLSLSLFSSLFKYFNYYFKTSHYCVN